MSGNNILQVILPDGRKPLVSLNPDDWPKVGETGFVPIEAVLPDPLQPRTTKGILNTTAHQQFTESVETHGQGMIVQVRPLDRGELNIVRTVNPLARYRIVDGERRYHASGARGADLQVLEITVRAYNDKRDVHLQQVVLNTMQEPLNTPDLARALAKIQDNFDLSANALAKKVNLNQSRVNDHLHLNNLPPDVLEMTNGDKHRKGIRLTIKPAVALSKVIGVDGVSAHDRQRELYQEMRGRGIEGADQQTAFFESYHSSVVREHSQKREPKRQRNRLEKFFGAILRNDLLSTNSGELARILTTASQTEIETLVGEAIRARIAIEKLVICLQDVADSRRNAVTRRPSNKIESSNSAAVNQRDKS